MLRGQLHHLLDFRTDQRSPQRRHRALTIDDGGDAEFLVDIARLSQATQLDRGLWSSGTRASEQFYRSHHGGAQGSHCAQKTTAVPPLIRFHKNSLLTYE